MTNFPMTSSTIGSSIRTYGDASEAQLNELIAFVESHPRLFVLSGAGISTDSGIPDYRDADGERKGRAPTVWQEFQKSEWVRKRYWARSMTGWRAVAAAMPNAGHRAIAQLQALGCIEQLVTQNVDGLHARAGSADAIELHGNLAGVVCMDCRAHTSRASLQLLLEQANPHFAGVEAALAPDGDAQMESDAFATFEVPCCLHCGGMLKPDVVFFGEGVPRSRVEQATSALERAQAVLVVGSSLMVYSGYRFCDWAARAGKPIAAINLGRTRADALFSLKVAAPCAETLVDLIAGLSGGIATQVCR